MRTGAMGEKVVPVRVVVARWLPPRKSRAWPVRICAAAAAISAPLMPSFSRARGRRGAAAGGPSSPDSSSTSMTASGGRRPACPSTGFASYVDIIALSASMSKKSSPMARAGPGCLVRRPAPETRWGVQLYLCVCA